MKGWKKTTTPIKYKKNREEFRICNIFRSQREVEVKAWEYSYMLCKVPNRVSKNHRSNKIQERVNLIWYYDWLEISFKWDFRGDFIMISMYLNKYLNIVLTLNYEKNCSLGWFSVAVFIETPFLSLMKIISPGRNRSWASLLIVDRSCL